MRILLTNDDGVDAPGLAASFRAVNEFWSDHAEIVVVAPDRCRSECSHAVSTGRTLRLKRNTKGWYSLDGTPVDCVRCAIGSVAKNPDLVISGVNSGANLGTCLMVSGTFAAARDAAMHGIPSMAISQYRHPDHPRTWDHVVRWMPLAIERFMDSLKTSVDHQRNSAEMLWNVNLPADVERSDLPPVVECEVD